MSFWGMKKIRKKTEKVCLPLSFVVITINKSNENKKYVHLAIYNIFNTDFPEI